MRGKTFGIKLEFGESKAIQNKAGIVGLAFSDTKMVYHLTNSEDLQTSEKIRYRRGGISETFQRPNMNRKYSKLMSGTDVMNQRESYYSMETRSARSYKKVGLHFIQMLEQNALCLAIKGRNS